jgi:membrane protease YdiL (CAAX protease family)
VERPPEADDAAARSAASPGRDVLAGAGLLLAGICFAFGGAALLARAPELPEAKLLASLAAQALFGCTAFGGLLIGGRALFPRGLRLERMRLGAAQLALLALGFVLTSHGLSLLLASFELRQTGTLGEIDRVVAAARGPSRLLAVAALGIAPAFGEELLFRGLVQQAALRRLRVPLAVAFSAVCFGLIHFDAVQSPAAFVLGLYLGAAVQIGGSLWVAILCHAVNNTLSVLTPAYPVAASGPALAAAVAGLLAAGAALLAGVARGRRGSRSPRGDSTPPGV